MNTQRAKRTGQDTRAAVRSLIRGQRELVNALHTYTEAARQHNLVICQLRDGFKNLCAVLEGKMVVPLDSLDGRQIQESVLRFRAYIDDRQMREG